MLRKKMLSSEGVMLLYMKKFMTILRVKRRLTEGWLLSMGELLK